MPTYEYRCPKGHVFDVFQKMSDPPKAKCPLCGKAGVRQMVPGAGFLLKGEGFYITDNRPDSYKKDASSDAIPGTTFEGTGGGAKKTTETGGGRESAAKDDGGAKAGSSEGGKKESGSKGGSTKRRGGKKGGE